MQAVYKNKLSSLANEARRLLPYDVKTQYKLFVLLKMCAIILKFPLSQNPVEGFNTVLC